MVSGAVAVLFLGLWSYWNRARPPLSPFVTMFLVGSLIDLWNLLALERLTRAVLQPYALLGAGLLLASYGSALIIMSGIGIRIMDLVAITIVRRWGWPFFAAKLLFESFFITTGWLLGGPVGVGTVAFLCMVGPFIQPFMWINGQLGLANHGLPRHRRPLAATELPQPNAA